MGKDVLFLDILEHIPDWMQELAKELDSSFLDKDEKELRRNFPGGKRVREGFVLIKERFWQEYHLSQQDGRRMVMSNVVNGIISLISLKRFCANPYFLAFLLSAPQNYELGLVGLLREYGLKTYKEILDTSLSGLEDKDAISLGKLKLSVLEKLENRVFGKSVSKHEIKNSIDKTLKVDNNGTVSLDVSNMRTDELEAEIKAIGGINEN